MTALVYIENDTSEFMTKVVPNSLMDDSYLTVDKYSGFTLSR